MQRNDNIIINNVILLFLFSLLLSFLFRRLLAAGCSCSCGCLAVSLSFIIKEQKEDDLFMNDFIIWFSSLLLIGVIWFCFMLLQDHGKTKQKIIILILIICACVYILFTIQPIHTNKNDDMSDIDPTIYYPRYIK